MANVKYLRERAELLRGIRKYFDDAGFYEVQPPCLSRDCVVDAYLDPLTIDTAEMAIADNRLPERFYLQTSPESAMKRMLANGAPSIYSIGPVFRSGEAGGLHNIEFTMLEWYEVGGDLQSAIALTGNLVANVLTSNGLTSNGYDTITYRQAFDRYADFDPIDISTDALAAHVAKLDAALAAGLQSDRDALLDVVMSLQVAPHLGSDRPTIVSEYPLTQAALAKPSPHDHDCAARFELFADGIELANGYDELLDARTVLQRARESNEKRRRSSREPLREETTLVKAMRQGLPSCSGVALGVDRLLMLTVQEQTIGGVLPFSIFDA